MLGRPGVLSVQPELIPPAPSTAIHGLSEFPELFERFTPAEKFTPSLERAKNTSLFVAGGILLCQITYVPPFASTPICGLAEVPRVFDRFFALAKFATWSTERLYKMA